MISRYGIYPGESPSVYLDLNFCPCYQYSLQHSLRVCKLAMESMVNPLDIKAGVLVAQLSRRFDQGYGIGSLSPAIYDTAWVAMVSKKVDGKSKWLFPECFQFLVKTQLENGGWPTYASEVDGLLNTLAATLALREHARAPEIEGSSLPDDIERRLSKATACLQCMLQSWNVESTVHVGFELLVPTLLQLLEHHDVYFQFPGRAKLMSLNSQKLAMFDARILYSKHQTTLVHSLEALALSIDFDKVSHHTSSDGSMMASPSSTAAYLIYSQVWNDRAEEYLRAVIRSGEGNGGRGVPSAFPTTIFELTWVCTVDSSSCFSRLTLE